MHGRSFFFAVLKNVASEKFKFSLSFQTQFATKKKNWSSPNVVYFEVEWLSKSTIYSVVWLVRKFSGVALCYKSNSICLSQKVCWFFLRDDFFWHFLAKNGKNGIKTQVAIDKNVIKMKLKHKWFIWRGEDHTYSCFLFKRSCSSPTRWYMVWYGHSEGMQKLKS